MMLINFGKVFAGQNSTTYRYIINRMNRSIFKRSTLDQEWRAERGLLENPNRFGPLTNLPDYTFLDGRPTPLGMRLRDRHAIQKEIAKKIVTLSSELDFAIERHNKLTKDKEDERKAIIESKLKPKGNTKLEKN